MTENANINFDYTEMVYGEDSKREMLCHNVYKGYEFFIISYGTHPCAYVKIPQNHPYYNKFYDDLPVSCHGRLTYSGFGLLDNAEFRHMITDDNAYYIGWDYAHLGDYNVYRLDYLRNEFFNDGYKWTVPEIYEEVKDVIEQLIEANK